MSGANGMSSLNLYSSGTNKHIATFRTEEWYKKNQESSDYQSDVVMKFCLWKGSNREFEVATFHYGFNPLFQLNLHSDRNEHWKFT